uniref:Tyrosine-protein kinase catalytic domain-containing protein n=1 Tax=Amphimedon queenslandica TaxID=400682 RepID=A0A1X7TR88_AMPQE
MTKLYLQGGEINYRNIFYPVTLVGVDIRSVYGNRNKYPNIEAWYYDGSSTYQKVLTLPIVLSPDNVTTNGLYRYILPTPISVSGSNRDNYRLGVYQPEDDSSVVRLYNATTSSTERVGRIRADSISESNIRVTGSNREADFQNTNNVFMLRLNTNPPNCFRNFFTETDINTNSLSVTSVIPVSDTRAFPDIQFTCSGIITNWIIGITQNQDTSKHYPNIYLKRSSELIHALTVDASAATSSNGNVYNFTSDIEVEYGDILVINVTTNSNPMYYQQYNGPLNYELDSSNGLVLLEHNEYPLISVITKPVPSVTETSSSTVTEDINTALHYKKYSSASDVWSYGAVMYEIWSIGYKPFELYTNQECIRLVDSGYRLPPPPGCPKPMYKLMIQCWNPDTHNRPSFSDISSSLSSPDKQLLMINKEDPVTVLGGALETSHSLYTDLQ